MATDKASARDEDPLLNIERSPKRRRISQDDPVTRSAPGSPNALAESHSPPSESEEHLPSAARHLKPMPKDLGTPRISIDSPIATDSPIGRSRTPADSADELDHNFYSRISNTLPVPHQSGVSTPRSDSHQASEDEYLASSSPIPSGTPTPLDYAPAVRYKPKLILRGHKRGVSAVKFSPDGKWICSCSADATVKIWSAATGAHVHTLRGHLAGISTLSWSPDSATIATGSDDKTIRLWAALTGQPAVRAPLTGHSNYVYCVVFSPKGNMLVSGSYDEAVFLWDVRTGRLMRTLPAHSDPVGGVDFSGDGTLIVSCASDGLIRVWDTATCQCLRTFFHEDTPPVVGVRFSPNGRYLATWMLDSCVRIWDYVEGRCVKTYQGHVNKQYSLTGAFGTYNGKRRSRAAAAAAEQEENEEEEEEEENDEETDEAQARGNPTAFVVSGSEDGAVVLWDVVSKRVLQRLFGHSGPVLAVDTHPFENAIASCGMDRTIRIWRDSRS